MTELHPLTGATRTRLVAAGLDPDAIGRTVRAAIEEDLAGGIDVTAWATVDPGRRASAAFVARAPGVLAGLPVVAAALDITCGSAVSVISEHAADGQRIDAGTVILSVVAPCRALLTVERTALNFVCHLSGVATRTRRWVDAVDGTRARVRDTRKTTPGLRALEKYAVRCGGGTNHRFGLSDMALVKDNHVAAAGGIGAAVERVLVLGQAVPIQVEVDSIDGLVEAIAAGVTEILIDNFDLDRTRRAVAYRDRYAPHVRLEASGGLTLAGARAVAETGVDWIAVGELTHSAPALDIGLDFVPVPERAEQT